MNFPRLFVVSAPSGGGKTTIVRSIRERHPDFEFSVSATTRQKRAAEENGKDYFFLAKEEFEQHIRSGALVEYERIYDNYYGTLKSEVDRTLAAHRSMLFDIDVRGGLSIKKIYGGTAVLIFIAPPSLQILEERLRNRKTEDEETFRKRMARVEMELEIGRQFDHTVINDILDRAVNRVDEIINNHIS